MIIDSDMSAIGCNTVLLVSSGFDIIISQLGCTLCVVNLSRVYLLIGICLEITFLLLQDLELSIMNINYNANVLATGLLQLTCYISHMSI